MSNGVLFSACVAGAGRRDLDPLLLELFDGARQVPSLADEGDVGDAVLFEYSGRVGSIFCGVVGAVFNPDGFSVKIFFQGFCHGIGLRSAAVWGATGDENGFAGLLLQVGAIT